MAGAFIPVCPKTLKGSLNFYASVPPYGSSGGSYYGTDEEMDPELFGEDWELGREIYWVAYSSGPPNVRRLTRRRGYYEWIETNAS